MGLTNPTYAQGSFLLLSRVGEFIVFILFQEKKKDKSKVILGWFWTEILYVRTVYTVYYLINTIGNPADQLCVGVGRERESHHDSS